MNEMFKGIPAQSGKVERFAEADFYDKRWEQEAEEAATFKRTVLRFVFNRNKNLEKFDPTRLPTAKEMREMAQTPDDFEFASALRDNEAFDKTRQKEFVDGERRVILEKLDAEYELWQEKLKPVIGNIKEAVKNPESGKRIMLVILGGGLKGPYSAAQVLGLHAAGVPPETFTDIIGISTGAPVASYYMAGPEQTAIGTSIYYEECTTKEFINLPRFWKVMDVARLTMDWMAKGPKKLDQEAVRNCGANLWYGVTRAIKRGEQPKEEFINAKEAKPGMLQAMRASASVPLVAGAVPPVNGIAYNDGAFDPLAIEEMINQFHPDTILILPNTPFDRLDTFQLSKTERYIGELANGLGAAGSLVSLAQLEKFMQIKEQMRKSIETIQKENNVNIGFLWPSDTGLDALKQNPLDMKEAVYRGVRDTVDAFGANQPDNIVLFETEKFKNRRRSPNRDEDESLRQAA